MNYKGGKEMEENKIPGAEIQENAGTVGGELGANVANNGFTVASNLPSQVSVWTKIKNILFQEITVELTPKQQKVEDEINAFLHQEITFKKVHDFLFQEITFGKKNK